MKNIFLICNPLKKTMSINTENRIFSLKVMKTKTVKAFLFSFVLVFAISSCTDEFFISGNGNIQTQNRQISNFDAISSNGDFHVTIVKGLDYSVLVKAESNLLPYIETSVSSRTLKITTSGVHSINHHKPIEIILTQPTLSGLKLSGSGWIKTDGFVSGNFTAAISGSGEIQANINAELIKASVSGSGKIYITGTAKSCDFRISGSGKIHSFDLIQDACLANISGSGNIYTLVNKALQANISGSGSVYYKGNPQIQSSISGSGKLIPAN